MSKQYIYTGSCHCQRIKFSFEAEAIERGLRCNCSLCERKGALMSAFVLSAEQLHIDASDEDLACYQFAENIAKHYFCKHCGIYTFHSMRSQPENMKVNLGCVENIDALNYPFDVFDGRNLLP